MKRLLLAIMLVCTPAIAHDWYPSECCGGQDCAIATVTFVASDPKELPHMMVETHDANGNHVAMVPSDFQVRESKDGNWHACFVLNQLFCLFGPPNT
jgi:hypothetical protein